MPPPRRVLFCELSLEDFPFRIEFYLGEPVGQEPLRVIDVSGPGVLDVPALGSNIWHRVLFADGSVGVQGPPGTSNGGEGPDGAVGAGPAA